MTTEERIAKAIEWADKAPRIPIEDYTVADCYARANYQLLLAAVDLLRESS